MNVSTALHSPGLHHFTIEENDVYGEIEIEHTEKDEVYRQIFDHTKEYVSWVPPVNILRGLDYMKIEITIPGITKQDCNVGSKGVFLWVKLRKIILEKPETFYCTFILPDQLNPDQLTASYESSGKIVIIIPREK